MNGATPLCRGRWLALMDQQGWEFVQRIRGRAVVIVLPRFRNGDTLLVSQYRPAVAAHCLEFPAGLVGDVTDQAEESLLQAAQRELLEETGYLARRLTPLFRGPSTPGMSSEIVDFILAEDLQHQHDGGGVDDEAIRVHRLAIDRVHHWASQQSGCLVDAKLYTGLWWLQQSLPFSESQR